MVDLECLSSAQARAYAGAARLCASQIGVAGQELTCLTDPAYAAESTEFEAPAAREMRARLDDVGGQLKGAQGNIGELVSLLNKAAEQYGELAETLHGRERAAAEAAREAGRSTLSRRLPPRPAPTVGRAFPPLRATPPPLSKGSGR